MLQLRVTTSETVDSFSLLIRESVIAVYCTKRVELFVSEKIVIFIKKLRKSQSI